MKFSACQDYLMPLTICGVYRYFVGQA